MKQPTTRILYDYWNGVRRNRMAPTRFEIEPSRIAPILSETFILERAGARSYQFRLAGTRICEHFGQELRGLDFTWIAADDTRAVVNVLDTVTHEGCGAVFEVEAIAPDGRAAHFEAIVLPLVHPADKITRYLGAISSIDPPAWLGSEPLEPSGLLSYEFIWPEGRPQAMAMQAHRQMPFAPELAAARIVRSDRRQFRILDGGRKE
ncbi:MAG: PAS domain-containing protein [Hyphomicrobiaceae bacterium]|nr:PAS domain-containing protein [Hyphomicrobiaceae bacterium]